MNACTKSNFNLNILVWVCSSSSSLKWHRKCSLIAKAIWNKACLIPSCYTHSHIVTHTRAFALKSRWRLLHDATVSLIISGKRIEQNADASFSCWLFTRATTHLPVKVLQFSGSIRITVSITIYVIKDINIDQSVFPFIGSLHWMMWCYKCLFVVVFSEALTLQRNPFHIWIQKYI